jgi:hypothetical protein
MPASAVPLTRLAAVSLAAMLTTATTVAAQDGPDERPSRPPLVIKAQGSFFVDGHTVHSDAVSGNPAGFGGRNDGDITVDQMYVQYQIPQSAGKHVPVVMLHGCCLSGKTWETTPDGRMGWAEYFLRKDRPVYVPDQSSRARSGFNATIFNEVKLGLRPASDLPSILMASHKVAWELFRFGPTYGATFSDEQFPVQAIGGLFRQMIPDLNSTLPTPNPTWGNLSRLAIRLRGAVLMGHSESGFFPEQAALINPRGIKGIITIETAFCLTTLTPQQLANFRRIPILVIFGDHLEDVPTYADLWRRSFDTCNEFVQQVNASGGDAQMMYLPALGIRGNSHMLMQDKNNLQLADLILRWIDRHVEGSH